MKKIMRGVVLAVLTIPVFCVIVFAQAQSPKFPDAAASDPVVLGWMQGFPPKADKIIRFGDVSFYRFPQSRWSFSNMRQLVPTVAVSRGDGPVTPLPRAERTDLDAVKFTTLDGREMTWGESIAANYTDGIVVLHKGRIVYEKFLGAFSPIKLHWAASVTKSFVGTLAAILVDEGKLDPEALCSKYVPELKDTAYADATLRQVMDMTVSVKFSEVYADPKADIWVFARATGMFPLPPNYDGPRNTYDMLLALTKQKNGEHGERFTYKSVDPEVLAWIISRVSGKSLAELTSEKIWTKLGAEHDACYWVDSIGVNLAGGGLNTSLRDLARFGEMLRLDGYYNGQQIVPRSVVADIRRGADKGNFAKAGYKTLPGWSYRNFWWVSHNEHGVYTARGVHGQLIWIDPKAEMVIARYASYPIASNPLIDPTSLPAYMAIAKHLMKD